MATAAAAAEHSDYGPPNKAVSSAVVCPFAGAQLEDCDEWAGEHGHFPAANRLGDGHARLLGQQCGRPPVPALSRPHSASE